MGVLKSFLFFSFVCGLCTASYHEQYRVPHTCSTKWESYIFGEKEYILQNLPVNWENAKILCKGHHNGTLAIVDTRDKAEFVAEALSESQLPIESIWVGARRGSAEDPAGYRWSNSVGLRRTAADVLRTEQDYNVDKHYPVWLNRTHVPVPEEGADCVALERVMHDRPVFLDLPCQLERAFVCERDIQEHVHVTQVKTVRCRSGMYHIYDGKLDWHQAAAHCVLNKMALANIASQKCTKKLGLAMLKNRPSIENAWIGARGNLGKWHWLDTGLSIFQTSPFADVKSQFWPPLRDRFNLKQSGCLQLDRHSSHPPVFLEARCERKMQFICYEGSAALSNLRSTTSAPSDDNYYYILVRQQLYWQHAFDNCHKMNGTLAHVENSDVLLQLLLVMGENKIDPISHIWVSGRLNMSRDVMTDQVFYAWYNPDTTSRIPDPRGNDHLTGVYIPPWLDEEFNMDSSCLNLDRQDHLNGLVYGLPCDTPQYSICMIARSVEASPMAEKEVTTSAVVHVSRNPEPATPPPEIPNLQPKPIPTDITEPGAASPEREQAS